MSQLGIFNASDRPSTSMHRSSKIWALRSRRRPWTSWYTRPGSGTTQPFNPKKDQSRKKGTGNLIFKTIVLSLLNHFTDISRDLYGYLWIFMALKPKKKTSKAPPWSPRPVSAGISWIERRIQTWIMPLGRGSLRTKGDHGKMGEVKMTGDFTVWISVTVLIALYDGNLP